MKEGLHGKKSFKLLPLLSVIVTYPLVTHYFQRIDNLYLGVDKNFDILCVSFARKKFYTLPYSEFHLIFLKKRKKIHF